MTESGLMNSVGKLLKFDFPNYYFTNQVYLKELKSTRDLCMKMMKVSEDEMKEFSNQRIVNEDHGENYGISNEQLIKELFEEEEILKQAIEKLEQDKQTNE